MDAPNIEQMQDKLDELWEKHLALLDQYDAAQKQLQKLMSSGFFSLAQATFKSPSRIRYGQDYYDDRMQATRRTTYAPNHDNHLHLDISLKQEEDEEDKTSEEEKDKTSEDEEDKTSEEEMTEQLPTPPATPLHHDEVEPEQHVPEDTPNVHVDEKRKQPTDPLHWYGILVPTQLRQAQTSFVTAIQGPVSHAANAANAMRRLEVDIRRLRKDIKRAEKKSLTDKAVEA